jgi:hypothetical protein
MWRVSALDRADLNGFSSNNCQNYGCNIFFRQPSRSRHVMKVLSASSHFANPKLDQTKWINVFAELRSQFLCDLAPIRSVIEAKLANHSLLVLYQNWQLQVIKAPGEPKLISVRSIRDMNSTQRFFHGLAGQCSKICENGCLIQNSHGSHKDLSTRCNFVPDHLLVHSCNVSPPMIIWVQTERNFNFWILFAYSANIEGILRVSKKSYTSGSCPSDSPWSSAALSHLSFQSWLLMRIIDSRHPTLSVVQVFLIFNDDLS